MMQKWKIGFTLSIRKFFPASFLGILSFSSESDIKKAVKRDSIAILCLGSINAGNTKIQS
jgi:hypothetical protein